jgi:hypothetical protein
VLNLAHLNNKFFFILGPIATSLKFDTELIDNNLCFSLFEEIVVILQR